MTATTKEADCTYKFMEFCTSKDGELIKAATGTQAMDPCRISNYARPEVLASNKMYPTLLDFLKAGKILADPDVPYLSSQLDDVEEYAVQNVLLGKMEPKDALTYMADNFDKLTKSTGLTK